MKVAYSYVRWSSEKQTAGDSLRRQTAAAEAYVQAHGLTLDTSTYRDAGVSAFKGKNAVEGALGAFLQAVDAGRIPRGATLIVESLDRVSRAEVLDALEVFTSIIKRGITLVTLQDNAVYSKESIKDNWTQLIISLSVLARAHEESLTKSRRVKAAWDAKRASGKPMTRMAPSWLSLVDGKWVIDKVKAKVVQRIFRLALEGHGTPSIARALNKDKVPTMQSASEWSFGVVNALLRKPAVIGELNGVEGYYPAIIEPEVFYAVQEQLKARLWKRGTAEGGTVRNLFSGMMYCLRCGGRMRAVGSSERHTYLRCANSYAAVGCDAPRAPYLAIERCLLAQFVRRGRPLVILNELGYTWGDTVKLEAELAASERKLNNLLELAAATGNAKSVAQKVVEHERSIERLKADIEVERRKEPPEQAMRETKQLVDEFLHTGGDRTVRLKVQAAIRRFLTKVEVEPEGPLVRVTYASGTVKDYDASPFREQVGGDRRPARA
jgi:DNA invertase Pin-like site-specific DNA recombinase